MNIRLHIERLVLDGLPVTRADAPRVKAAMESELSRLLAAGGVSGELLAGGALPRVDAAPMHAPRGATPAQLGREIATSVFSGIGQR